MRWRRKGVDGRMANGRIGLQTEFYSHFSNYPGKNRERERREREAFQRYYLQAAWPVSQQRKQRAKKTPSPAHTHTHTDAGATAHHTP